jgi:hypothetical protein
MERKGAGRRGRKGKKDVVSLSGLLAAQKLVAEAGSIESAKEALGVVERLS